MALRIGGVVVDGPAEEVLVLPRMHGDIIFRARAVTDMSPFEGMCPMPVVPRKLLKGGFKEDVQNPNYLGELENHNSLRFAYICIKSLEPSEIEWQQVKPEAPKTWLKWDEELRTAGLSQVEINHVVRLVMQANSLDQAKLDKARESFLAGMAVPLAEASSQNTERPNSPSGEPVKDSE